MYTIVCFFAITGQFGKCTIWNAVRKRKKFAKFSDVILLLFWEMPVRKFFSRAILYLFFKMRLSVSASTPPGTGWEKILKQIFQNNNFTTSRIHCDCPVIAIISLNVFVKTQPFPYYTASQPGTSGCPALPHTAPHCPALPPPLPWRGTPPPFSTEVSLRH